MIRAKVFRFSSEWILYKDELLTNYIDQSNWWTKSEAILDFNVLIGGVKIVVGYDVDC